MLRRRVPSARRRSLTTVAVLAVAAVLLLGDLVGLDRWLPVSATVALRPGLAAVSAAVALGLLAWRRRWWPVAVPVLVVAAVVGALVVPRTVAEPAPPPGGRDLTLLSFNVMEGQADPGALAGAIRASRADLVVLPEAGERFRERVGGLLPGYRSWTNAAPGAPDVRAIVVLAAPSAGPVIAQRLDDGTRYPWAVLSGGVLGTTRLVAVHLVAPVPAWIDYWPGELASLQRWCAAGSPALVVGDLNSTPDHSAFRAGTRGCADGATERGTSLAGTWPAYAPRALAAQIDHVLTTDGPRAVGLDVVDLPGSDHRALVARLRLP